jgi:hypothetical protein
LSTAQTNLLALQRLSSRLTAEQAAWCLGFSPKEVPVLASAKLLKPLGHPTANQHNYFALASGFKDFRPVMK